MTNEMIMQEQLEEVLLIMAEKGLIPYKDGNAWCILLGENIQEGICGFGYTIIDAMMDFYKEATAEGIIRKEEQKSVKDKIIEDTISYLNGGMCFYNSVEELKYRSNLAYRLKSLSPQPKQEWSEEEKQKEQKPTWSEEDEKMLKCCLIAINHYEKTCNIGDHLPTIFNIGGYLASVDKVKSWLKSIRPGWKPREEHLSALLAVFNDPNNIGSQTCQLALTDLYEQLKKL